MIHTHVSALGAMLLLCALSPAQEPPPAAKEARLVAVATLGLVTRPATAEEAKEQGLKIDKCVRGQVVTEVAKESAAAAAGVEPGDVLIQLGKIDLFSGDDLADFLRVSKPGQKVEALIRRAKNGKEETVPVTLGAGSVEPPKEPRLEWQFASLAQLPLALAKAKKEGRLVLVGLSGAET